MPFIRIVRKIFERNETGVSLLETLVALALLGLIAVAFAGGLTTTFRATRVSEDRVIAESLAKSQLEHIKAQGYVPTADYDPANPEKCYTLVTVPANLVEKGYAVEVTAPQSIIDSGGEGFELQNTTVVVTCNGQTLITISGYRVGRVN